MQDISELSLQPGEVQVWLLEEEALLALAGQARSVLGGEELAQSLRMADPVQARLWLGRRVGLRRLLAAYTGLPAGELRLQRGLGVKPRLAPTQPGPCFSMTASGPWMAAAFGHDELGLDVELLREDIIWQGLADRYFSAEEKAFALGQATAARQRHAFFQVWTRKEAQLKLHGVGLAGLDSLSLAQGLGRHWVEDLTLAPPLVGSLALERAPAWVRVRRWPAWAKAGGSRAEKQVTMASFSASEKSLSPP